MVIWCMRNRCTVDGCDRFVVGWGYCSKHYNRVRSTGTTSDRRKNARGVCSVEGCGRPHAANGLCHQHWKSPREKQKRLVAKVAEPRTCGFCDAEIDPARLRRGPVSYCSRQCKNQARIVDGRNATAARKSYFKRRYGLTIEQVESLATAGCGICGTVQWNGRHARPHVDHCHKTGRVRGVLCSECNTGLGKFRDDPNRLEAAMRYLASSIDYTP